MPNLRAFASYYGDFTERANKEKDPHKRDYYIKCCSSSKSRDDVVRLYNFKEELYQQDFDYVAEFYRNTLFDLSEYLFGVSSRDSGIFLPAVITRQEFDSGEIMCISKERLDRINDQRKGV